MNQPESSWEEQVYGLFIVCYMHLIERSKRLTLAGDPVVRVLELVPCYADLLGLLPQRLLKFKGYVRSRSHPIFYPLGTKPTAEVMHVPDTGDKHFVMLVLPMASMLYTKTLTDTTVLRRPLYMTPAGREFALAQAARWPQLTPEVVAAARRQR